MGLGACPSKKRPTPLNPMATHTPRDWGLSQLWRKGWHPFSPDRFRQLPRIGVCPQNLAFVLVVLFVDFGRHGRLNPNTEVDSSCSSSCWCSCSRICYPAVIPTKQLQRLERKRRARRPSHSLSPTVNSEASPTPGMAYRKPFWKFR